MSTIKHSQISALLVDDDAKLCGLLRDYLEGFGFSLDVAEDALLLVELGLLHEDPDAVARGQTRLAVGGLIEAGHDLEDRGLSGTVRSYESCFFVVFYMKGAAGDNYFLSKGFFDIVTCKYHPILLDKIL